MHVWKICEKLKSVCSFEKCIFLTFNIKQMILVDKSHICISLIKKVSSPVQLQEQTLKNNLTQRDWPAFCVRTLFTFIQGLYAVQTHL